MNVPFLVNGVPVPVNVRVLEPLAEKTWEASMVKLVIAAEEPRFKVVLALEVEDSSAPKEFIWVLSVKYSALIQSAERVLSEARTSSRTPLK